MVSSVKPVLDQEEPYYDLERYGQLVGKLNYLIVTHLNIAFGVSIVS